MSLRALWKMNESTGATALLDHIGGFDATISGTVTLDQPGLVTGPGRSVTFGTGWAELGTPAALTGLTVFSIVAWINGNNNSSTQRTILTHQNASTNRWRFNLNRITDATSNLQFQGVQSSTNPNFIGNTVISAGTTYMVGMSYDQSTGVAKLYVNGVEDTYGTSTTGAGTLIDGSSVDLAIGARAGDGSRNFLGGMDELALYDHVLSAYDIARLYYLGVKGNRSVVQPVTAGVVQPVAGY